MKREKTKVKENWLKQGYEDFAMEGPEKLSINQIARCIGTARSSFYHYFGDIDIFVDELLAQHYIC